MVKLQPDVLERLGKLAAHADQAPPEPPPPPKKKIRPGGDDGWKPMLGPEQQEAFDSIARFLLCDGEKGSGKTIGLLHKMVRHCYENNNALGLILVRVKAMATKGGAWDKLMGHVLPRWRDGNRNGKGELIDEGLGIEYTEVRYDRQQNEYIWVENRFGGWSMIVLISAPHSSQLRERMRGYEPSIALVDELTSCPTREYLTAVAIQVGRREGIEGPQQYMAACNPEGPSHWVHKVWFEEAFDPVTGEWDRDYHRIHVPIESNEQNLPPGYLEGLRKLYRNDPVEAARMLHGEWVDRLSGEAIFKDIFVVGIHVLPRPPSLDRILPDGEFPLLVGIDPGAVNNAFIFMQWMPVNEAAMKWIIFDELVYVQRRLRYDILLGSVLRRVKFWNDFTFGLPDPTKPAQKKKRFRVVWVADNSAFNQFRAAHGSFDVLDFEKIANEPKNGAPPLHETLGLQRMRVVAAPKFAGSVRARTRLVMDLLGGEEIVISAGCTKVIEMFQHLESEDQKAGQEFDPDLSLTPKRSVHIHPYDALCNPILTSMINPRLLTPPPETSQEMMRIGS